MPRSFARYMCVMKRFVITWAILGAAGAAGRAQSLQIYTEISPPLQMQGADGKLVGIGADTVQEIQKRIGNKDPIRVVAWSWGYAAALQEPNVLLFSMARSAQRDPLFQWVGPIAESSYCLWMKADAKVVVKSLDEARSLHAIGVYQDDVRDQYLSQLGFRNLIRSTDNEVNAGRLALGSLDAFAGSAAEIASAAKAAGYQPADFKKAIPLFKLQAFLAFSRNTPRATVAVWKNALEAMRKDGTFERIFHKYSPNKPLPDPASTAFCP